MKAKLSKTLWILAAVLAARLVVMAVTPVFDPSEARYAALAANMARTGDFLVPRFTYKGVWQSFDGKPPLVFQAGGLAAKVLGVNEFAVRLFPLLSALLLLFILHRTVNRLDENKAGLAAVTVCATSVAFYATAGFCMTDVPLTCCVGGALLVYAVFREAPRLRDAFVIAVLLGCGMLVKGPVALVLFGLPVVLDAAINRRWKSVFDIRWIAAAPLFFLVAAPWFVLMHRENPDFLRYFFVNENLLRFLVRDYGDKYGAGRETFRGMAVVWTLVVTLPWSLLPLRDACAPLFRRHSELPCRARRRPAFFTLAIAAITGFWCLTSRVPLTYLLPIVPLFAASFALGGHHRLHVRQTAKFLPIAAVLAVAALIGTLAVTRCATHKMMGAEAPKRTSDHHFSYEFYHGPWGAGAPSPDGQTETVTP